jgi:peptidyl-prolyl cis-trans isomerase A (cyclophilin A)
MKALRCWLILAIVIAFTRRVEAGTLVVFHVFVGVNQYVGDIEVELYDQDKPITVQNFLKYLNAGFYQNDFFHRCIPGFVAQGGGASTASPTSTDSFVIWSYVPTVFGPITNEFLSGTRRSNTYGTIAMARTADLNSATSQFYFNLADNSANLDNPTNYYCVFGQVVRGTNVMNVFNTVGSGGIGIFNMEAYYGTNANTAFVSQLPVTYSTMIPPRYEDLVYTIITPLTLQAVRTNNAMQLSWTSINGLTNNVEYATNILGTWQVLTNVVGNGNPQTAVDTNQAAASRFYRIHVLY